MGGGSATTHSFRASLIPPSGVPVAYPWLKVLLLLNFIPPIVREDTAEGRRHILEHILHTISRSGPATEGVQMKQKYHLVE